MNFFQKCVKFFAVILAVCIIAAIISSIWGLATGILGVGTDNGDTKIESRFSSSTAQNALYMDIGAGNVTIEKGDTFTAYSECEKINCRQEGNRIIVTEKGGFVMAERDRKVTVYIPENLMLDEVYLYMGAGKLNADVINTKSFYLDLGAGEITIDRLLVSDKTDIDSGAGKLTVKSGDVNNVKADTGTGQVNFAATLRGKNEFDHGIGELNLTVLGRQEEYTVNIDNGIGDANINGKSVSDGEYGSGTNVIDIDNGIGEANINFEN